MDDPTLTLQRDRASASDIQGSAPLLYGNAAAIAANAAKSSGLGTVPEDGAQDEAEHDTTPDNGKKKDKCFVM